MAYDPEYHKAYRIRNKEKIQRQDRLRAKRWREQNPAKAKRRWQNWIKRNRPKHRADSIRWNKLNVPARRAAWFRWFSRLKGQKHPLNDTLKDRAVYALSQQLTKLTGIKWVVDHIIPLHHGGYHHHDNIQPLPATINETKKDDPFWEHPGFKSWRDVPSELWPDQLKAKYQALL